MNKRNICTIILNWNNAPDTIRSAKSVLDNTESTIILVDNFSNPEDRKLLKELAGALSQNTKIINEKDISKTLEIPALTILENNSNYGYAGGNNRGLQLAAALGFDYFWILNNDTIVQAESLNELVRTIESDERFGFASSILVYEDNPEIIQCLGGGKLYPWLGKAKLVGKNTKLSASKKTHLTHNIDYLMGASLLVKRSIVSKVGLMNESYFMYSEEADWQYEARAYGITAAVALGSIVTHGDSKSTRGASHRYHYYRNRAAIMFNKKHHSIVCAIVSTVLLSAITAIQNYNKPKCILFGLKGAIEGLAYDWGS